MRRLSKSYGWKAALLCLTASVVLAACGSGSKDSGSGSDLPGKPIKIMMIYTTGGLVSFPELPEGAKAAVDGINKAGGIKGRPLELFTCSDGNNANTAGDCARKALDEHVVSLVGNASTFSTVYMPVMTQHHIPSIGTIPAGAADFASTTAFPIVGGPSTTFANLPRFVADQGAKKIVLVRPDIAVAVTAATASDKALAYVHEKLAGQVAVPITAPDMSSYVAQTTDLKADGAVVILPGAQAIEFVKQLKQAAPNMKIGLAAPQPGPVYASLGASGAGIVQAQDFLPTPGTDTVASKRYAAEMKAAGYDDLSGYRVNSWLSVEVFAKLARELPEITGPALEKKIVNTSGLRTGLTPPLQWKQGNVNGTPRSFTGCSLATQLQKDGSQKPVTGRFFDSMKNENCPTP